MAMTFVSGAYLLSGGRGCDPTATVRMVRRVLGGFRHEPFVACIGAANGDDPEFFRWTREMLGEAGARECALVPLASENADTVAAQDILRRADIVFVEGGDVEAGMNTVRRHGLVALLRQMAEKGTPFIGVSAGSIMLGEEWVRWADPTDNSSAERFACLGIVPVVCDTHGESDRWEELITLLALSPIGTKGYGLRSGAVMAVDRDGGVNVWHGVVDLYVTTARGPEAIAELVADEE